MGGIFCGGIKIDAGMDWYSESKDLDERQPFIGNVLGQFFDVAVMQCRRHKLKHGILRQDPYYDNFEWNEIMDYNQGLKGMQWSMKHFVAPCYGFGDNLKGYLK